MENRLFTAPELGEFFLGLVHFFRKKTKNSASFFLGLVFFLGGGEQWKSSWRVEFSSHQAFGASIWRKKKKKKKKKEKEEE